MKDGHTKSDCNIITTVRGTFTSVLLGLLFATCSGCFLPANATESSEEHMILAVAGGSGRLLEFTVSKEIPIASPREITSISWMVGGVEVRFDKIAVGSQRGSEPRVLIASHGKIQQFEPVFDRGFAGTTVSMDNEGWLAADSTGISVFSFSGGLRKRIEQVTHFRMPVIEVTDDGVLWFLDPGNRLVAFDYLRNMELSALSLPPPRIEDLPSGSLLGSCEGSVFASWGGQAKRCWLSSDTDRRVIRCEGLSGWGKRVQHVACCGGSAIASRTIEFPRYLTEFGLLESGPTTRLEGVAVHDFACLEPDLLEALIGARWDE
jgi:hypothetical protein